MDTELLCSIKNTIDESYDEINRPKALLESLKACENNSIDKAIDILTSSRDVTDIHAASLTEHLLAYLTELRLNILYHKVSDAEASTTELLDEFHSQLEKASDKISFPEKIDTDAEDLILLMKDVSLCDSLEKSKELISEAKRTINAKKSPLAAILLQVAADMLFCAHKHNFAEELNSLALVRFLTSMDFKTYTVSKSTQNLFLFSSENVLMKSEKKVFEVFKMSELYPLSSSIIDAATKFASESTSLNHQQQSRVILNECNRFVKTVNEKLESFEDDDLHFVYSRIAFHATKYISQQVSNAFTTNDTFNIKVQNITSIESVAKSLLSIIEIGEAINLISDKSLLRLKAISKLIVEKPEMIADTAFSYKNVVPGKLSASIVKALYSESDSRRVILEKLECFK